MRLTSTIVSLASILGRVYAAQSPWNAPTTLGHESDRVNVTLYVMSRCPDAVRLDQHSESLMPAQTFSDCAKGCLRTCSRPVGSSIRLISAWHTLRGEYSFLTPLDDDRATLTQGRSRNASEPLGYTCKHGELECVGNAHQLCLHAHLPLSTFYANLACQNYQHFPGDIGKLSLTKQCAEASKVDWMGSGVGGCIEGRRGRLGKEAKKLFKENAEETIAENVTTSCTVSIRSPSSKTGFRRCVVDGGVWKGCDVSDA